MKKTISIITILGMLLIGTSLSAEEIKTEEPVKAEEIKTVNKDAKTRYIGIGYAETNFLEEDITSISFSFGVYVVTKANILFGIDALFENASVENSLGETIDANAIASNIKVGYALNGFSAYGIVGVKVQTYDDIGFGGFGTGIGFSYRAHKNFEISLDSVNYTLKRDDNGIEVSYDNDVTGLTLKYCY